MSENDTPPHRDAWPPPPKRTPPSPKPANYVKWRRYPDPAGMRALRLSILGCIIYALAFSPNLLPNTVLAASDRQLIFVSGSIVGFFIDCAGFIIGVIAVRSREGKLAIGLSTVCWLIDWYTISSICCAIVPKS